MIPLNASLSSSPKPPTRRHILTGALAVAGGLASASFVVPANAAQQSPSFSARALTGLQAPRNGDGGLDQDVRSDEPTSKDKVLFTRGHVDLGPRWVGDQWTLELRDDSGKSPVWRSFDKTVFTVKDETRMTVPEDARYDFIGEKPGTPVYVLPQTEKQGIPWPGWNTQHPSALKVMGKGTDFTLDRVSGPGAMIMYLENGTLDKPQVLWDSRKNERQNIFASANSHTHANWVFTKPGIYYLQVTASAKKADGTLLTSTQVLRFAVGSATDPAPGFAADPFAGVSPSTGSGASADGPGSSAAPWVIGGAGAAGVAVIGGLAAVRRRKIAALATEDAESAQPHVHPAASDSSVDDAGSAPAARP